MARKHWFRLLMLSFCALWLSGCTGTQTSLPWVDELPTAAAEDGNAQAGAEIDPWLWVERAQDETDLNVKNQMLLVASAGFIAQGHIATAQSTLDQVSTSALDANQAIEYQIIQARLKLIVGDVQSAQTLINASELAGIPEDYLVRFLELKADVHTAKQQFESAIAVRLQLSDRLTDSRAKASAAPNLSKLYILLRQLSPPQRNQLLRQSTHRDIAGWIDLIDTQASGAMDEQRWRDWQQRYPNHPAGPELFAGKNQFLLTGKANNIALLLPMTSNLGRAAEAFKEGFVNAERAATGQNKTRIYDIGAEFDLSPIYYQSAINDGADFIVGPLGRKAVQALQAQGELALPTLFMGAMPADSPHLNAWGLGLSPEQDAAAIAEQAIQSGFKSAGILRRNNAWGERVASAFNRAFTQKGGTIKTEQRFLTGLEDITTSVKNLLTINASEIRHQRLQQLVGRRLQHSVRRRDDIDFVFIAASAADARKLVPLLKFYRAHDLPLYATSSVFSGKFSRIRDADLNGLSFVDLPWLLHAASKSPRQALRYGGSGLDRLYALGYAAYEVIPELNRLQADPWQQFEGRTMSLRLNKERNLIHNNAWAQFTENGVDVQKNP